MTRLHTEPQYLIELEAHDGTVYGFATGRGFAPVDPDAELYRGQYDGRVSADTRLVVRRETDGAGSSTGAAGQSFGAITLNNADGGLDVLGEKGFDGRALRILFAPAGARSMADCEPVYRGTVTELQVQRLTVTIQPRDRLEELNTPIGSTVDAAEWPEADGERMPVVAGAAVSVPLFWLDRVLLIAAVHDGEATVNGVYDLGVALTAGAAYADMAELKSTAPASGQYRVLSTASGTFVRLGSRPQDHDKMAADVATATTDGPSQLISLASRAESFGRVVENLVINSHTGGAFYGTGPAALVEDNVADPWGGNTAQRISFDKDAGQVLVRANLIEKPSFPVTVSFWARIVSQGGPWFIRADVSDGSQGDFTDQLSSDWKRISVSCGDDGVTDLNGFLDFGLGGVGGSLVMDVAGADVKIGDDLTAYVPSNIRNLDLDVAHAGLNTQSPEPVIKTLGRDWTVGGWWPGETSILDAVSEIARSLGAVIFFDRLGRLSAARLTPEAGAGVIGIYGPQETSPGGGARRATELDRLRLGKPAREVSVGYSKSHAFYSDLGALWDTAPARAERISREYARSVTEDAAVATKHLLASSMRLDTILENKAQAETVAEELRAAQGAWFHTTIINADETAFQALDLGARVDIHESRWSGSAISTVVREIAHDLTAGTITLGVRE